MTESFKPEGEIPREMTEEEMEAEYQSYMERHPVVVTLESGKREARPEIALLEGLLETFETTHSFEALHQIIELKPEDVANYPEREAAKKDLEPIVRTLNTLRDETNISRERYLELKERYMLSSRAVGIINNGIVDHNRSHRGW